MNRRSFLQNSALSAAALALPNLTEIVGSKQKIGLQLYSVRDDIAKNADLVFEQLAKFGFRNVEAYGLENGTVFNSKLAVADFKKMLAANGLKMPSSHINLKPALDAATEKRVSDFKKIVDDASSIGASHLVYPWLPPEMRSVDNIKKSAAWMNEAAVIAKKQGISLGYHNHDFEFLQKAEDGRLLYEILLHETDPKLVHFELDLYWVALANRNPLDWLKLYPGRFRQYHVKDMAKTPKRETVEIGNGSMDFQSIFNAFKGIDYYHVELEHYLTTPMQGVELSLKNLKKLRF